jgi:signal transduction histidine kinase
MTDLEVANLELRLENETLRRRLHERVEALRAAEQGLRALDRSKRDFITLMSHELRTPLTSVIGTAEVILYGICDSKTEILSMVRTIASEARRLSRFVDDAMEFLEWAAGHLKPQLEPVDPVRVLEDVILRLRPRYAEKSLQVSVGEPTGDRLLAEERALDTCLERILDNAMKFSRPGGKIEVAFAGDSREGRPFLSISVRDEGEGVPAERARDLASFLTLCHDPKNHTSGAGLSLALVREIVGAHGGSIRITSPGVGQGCEAVLSFPRVQSPAARNERLPSRREARILA